MTAGRPDGRRALGAEGEAAAAAWYAGRGFEVVARNWRCREGEIDLVLRKGRLLVFCEVKARTSNAFGAPVEAVTRSKQARLRRLAARWLREQAAGRHASPGPDGAPAFPPAVPPAPARPSGPDRIRFDVVSVLGGEVTVVENAF